MITKEKARELFEAKIRWVEQQTGKDIKLGLMMMCGPDDSAIVYERMFACYLAGLEAGIDQMKGKF